MSRFTPLALAVARAKRERGEGARESAATGTAREADRAMAWLKQAVAAGYQDVDHIKKDTALDTLREREDFNELIAELEKKNPPNPGSGPIAARTIAPTRTATPIRRSRPAIPQPINLRCR